MNTRQIRVKIVSLRARDSETGGVYVVWETVQIVEFRSTLYRD